MVIIKHKTMPRPRIQTTGFMGVCSRCNTTHGIDAGNTAAHCHKLMEMLSTSHTLALQSNSLQQRKKLSTASLFGPSMGKMFGVMECRAEDGTLCILKAFSGQFNGCWTADGWCPPLFDVAAFEVLTTAVEAEIKELGARIKALSNNSAEWRICKKQRKMLSQQLMRRIHELYEVHNFNGEILRLPDLFSPGQGIPTGTGDCCAPKLLNYAAKNNLRPLGMSEFYWGWANRSGSRRHGKFYQPCDDKCGPILAAMLCGLN